jgi:hypothetical protein
MDELVCQTQTVLKAIFELMDIGGNRAMQSGWQQEGKGE